MAAERPAGADAAARRRRRRLALAVLVLALLALGTMLATQHNQVVAHVGGLEIVGRTRTALSRATCSAGADAVEVRLGPHTARVTADSVERDGHAPLPIPRGCRRVELRQTADGLRVDFDGGAEP
jgi:hypothetical protein